MTPQQLMAAVKELLGRVAELEREVQELKAKNGKTIRLRDIKRD